MVSVRARKWGEISRIGRVGVPESLGGGEGLEKGGEGLWRLGRMSE